MPHLDLAFFNALGNLWRELQEPQQIADAGARAANGFCRLLMRQANSLISRSSARASSRDSGSHAGCFRSGPRNRGFVGNAADDGGNLGKARHLGSAPTTLPRDDFVPLRLARGRNIDRSYDDRLNDALGLIESASSCSVSGRMSMRGWYFPRCRRSRGSFASSSPTGGGAAAVHSFP